MDTMRRLLFSLTALSLLGVVVGCRVIDGLDADCGCDSCGCGTSADAPMPPTGPPTAPATKPGPGAVPESIKEMPKAVDNSPSKDNAEDVPLRLTPEPDGLELK